MMSYTSEHSMNKKRMGNVKISETVLSKESVFNLISKSGMKLGPTRSRSNMFSEALDKIQSQRNTLKLVSSSTSYAKLRVSSFLRYFREDWGGITALRYFQAGDKIAVGFNSGDLLTCSLVTESPTKWDTTTETILTGWEGNDSISCIQFHPKHPNMLYASSTAGTVMRRDLEDSSNYNDFFITEEDNEIYSMDFPPDRYELVTAGRDAVIRLYDLEVERRVSTFGQRHTVTENSFEKKLIGHEKRIYCVRCDPEEPSIIVSGGWDGVRVWDTRSRKPSVRTISGPFIFGDAVDICKGKILTASCVARNGLEMWDMGSGFLIQNIEPSNKRVYLYGEYPYVARFFKGDPTGDLVLYGVGGLQFISVKESSILYLFEDEKPVVAADSTDKKISYGGKSNSLLCGKILFPETELTISSYSYSSHTLSTYDSEIES